MDDKFIAILKEAQNLEERVIPLYMQHLESAIFWTGLDKITIGKVRGMLKRLSDDSKRHKAIVDNIIKSLQN
ncbi:MAG: hypothetical protein PHQ54_02875 [Candidatus Omnitrophica bacterium]|nr:hypothetical protein [Candidatus Omnitrophota bacterium]